MNQLKKWLNKARSQAGFTMMELVIVILCTSIIMAATIPLFRVQTDAYVKVREGKKLQQEARIGFNRLVAELRQLEESSQIDYGLSNQIQFDIPGQYNLEYEVSGGSLCRRNTRLVDGVRLFRLTYYKADGTTLSTPFYFSSDVWRIKVELEVGDDANQVRFQSQITPRNFHYN